MIDVFASLKALIRPEDVLIDTFVFRLHYKATVLLLLTFTILVTSFQYFGDPIECESDAGVKARVMNLFCWMKSTFIIQDSEDEKTLPGLGTVIPGKTEVIYQQYYQWVFIILFLQAILMYFPAYLWKNWEKKLVSTLCSQLDKPFFEEKDVKIKKAAVIRYLQENMGHNQLYFIRYVFCEFLNLVNVLLQMFWMDFFLNHAFFNYGTNILDPNAKKGWAKTVAQTFPKLTKCHFHKFGSSGSINMHDALCVLPLNMLNEKIYIVLWVWYVFLAFLSSSQIIVRCIEMFSQYGRFMLLRWKFFPLEARYVKIINKKFAYGDIFLLSLLSNNLNSKLFGEICRKLCNSVSNTHYEYEMNFSNFNDSSD